MNMEWASRLLCEGWTEKKVFLPVTDSSKPPSAKWKTRYATVTLIHSNAIEMKFHPKKAKSSTELCGERITLLPWRYCISSCPESSKPHAFKILDFETGLSKPCTRAVILSMRTSEEASAWIRCIQALTKLEPGMERSKYTVLTNNAQVFQRLCAVEAYCILHISSEVVTLALKTDQSVLTAWPLTCIRTYSSPDHSHFTISAGRSSPHGEGIYHFQTTSGDASKLFRLMDFHTGVTSKVETDSLERFPTANPARPSALPTQRFDPPRGYLPMSPQNTLPPPKPPRKPPLPERKKPLSATPSIDRPQTPVSPVTRRVAPNTVVPVRVPPKLYSMADPVSDGLYELDNLLKTLEHSMTPESETVINAVDENVLQVCEQVLKDLVDAAVEKIEGKYISINESSPNKPGTSHGYEKLSSPVAGQQPGNGRLSSGSQSYSTINFERKSVRRAAKIHAEAK